MMYMYMENNMEKIDGYRVIATPTDVACFLSYLVLERGLNVNPDDSFAEYVDENGKQLFTPSEIECYESMMDTSWELCNMMNVDIYEMALRFRAISHLCNGNNELKEFVDTFTTKN